jgi:hypothetical protein
MPEGGGPVPSAIASGADPGYNQAGNDQEAYHQEGYHQLSYNQVSSRLS